MAYRRRYGSYKAKRRTKRSARPSRSTVKTPRYRRTRRTSRPMSKKRILNVTSTKKRDDMSSWVYVANSQGTGYNTVQAPAVAAGNQTGASASNPRTTGYIWCPTARDFTSSTSGAKGNISDIATRTASTCYMRGIAERIEVQTSTGIPWQWRRICFRYRGNLYGANGNSQSGAYQTHLETTNGFQRVSVQFTDTTATGNTIENSLTNLIFRGTPGSGDWFDYMNAPLDPTRIDIAYDKQTVISSGNASGKIFRKKLWHPMNKNLVYDDDEQGGTEASTYYSMHGKQGMGDYYIVDFFKAGIGAAQGDQLSFEPQSTLYWHEK
uniref:Capsid protein n=1 Tax=Red panda feces-associated gemycircularvirus TaxID=2864013 RepID=A0A8K1HJH8_9VIRU|nr:capsid protein [Red panda feces-associated gemycircularvirus]